MGGYDLYGNYYPREVDAANAEMAQCANLDSSLLMRQNQQLQEAIAALQHRIETLEQQQTTDKQSCKASPSPGLKE